MILIHTLIHIRLGVSFLGKYFSQLCYGCFILTTNISIGMVMMKYSAIALLYFKSVYYIFIKCCNMTYRAEQQCLKTSDVQFKRNDAFTV